MKKYTTKNYHSSFWYDEHEFDEKIVFSSLSEGAVDTLKKYRLSSARKAISNFVSITTGKNIPVKFATNNSYTDGKSVVISGDIDNPEKFDIGVGLALHEGSHILLSDFDILHKLQDLIPAEIFTKAESKGIQKYQILRVVKDLSNVVEDRRIDNFIYKNAPGYREYYLKLYNYYFGDKTIEKGLESDDYKVETIEAYMFRIINLMNPKSDLISLKGLRDIYRTIDLKNIERLKSTNDTLNVAISIMDIILNNIDVVEKPEDGNKSNEGEQGEQSGDGQEGDGNAQNMEGDSNETENDGPSMNSNGSNGNSSESSSDSNEDGEGEGNAEGDGGSESDTQSNGNSNDNSNTLPESAKRKLNRIIKQQKDFLEGNTKKKNITKTMEQDISSIDSQGAEIVHVGDNYTRGNKGCNVIVLKNLTKKMLEDDNFHMSYSYTDWKTDERKIKQIITNEEMNQAEMMGTMLGKKLQVRNESRETIFNRQKNGKIDGRMIASLGFENENVFTQTFVDKFKKANIHLTIDASGSMGGIKWRQTMINAIALAKATSMISNLEMQITFRYSDNNLPVILFAYDSRKDSYQKVKSIFPYLRETGTTPEGLTFEAIQKMLVPSSNDLDSFFVNISDGEPCFSNKDIQYSGADAAEHTRKEVDKIKQRGIGVLSYFVSDSNYGSSSSSMERFKKMYGADSKFININSIGEVTNTLNKMFLTK
jgi:hypothetical protein